MRGKERVTENTELDRIFYFNIQQNYIAIYRMNMIYEHNKNTCPK